MLGSIAVLVGGGYIQLYGRFAFAFEGGFIFSGDGDVGLTYRLTPAFIIRF